MKELKRRINRVALRALLVIAGAATLFSFAACERGPQGIFYSIATAEKIVEGNLPKGARAYGMVEASVNVDGEDLDYYFAAVGGRVWYRRADGDETDWSRLANPSGYRTNHSRPTSIVNLDGTIYVSFVEGERERSGVYELNPADRTFAPSIPGAFNDGVRIVWRLFALPGTGTQYHLFATIMHREDSGTAKYELWYLGGNGTPIELDPTRNLTPRPDPDPDPNLPARLDVPFISATSDATTGYFWFITTEKAYHVAEVGLGGELSEIDRPAGGLTTLGGIFFYDENLYLSSRRGTAVDGGSQGLISSVQQANLPQPDDDQWSTAVSLNDRAFTDFAFAADLPGVGDALLVGTYRTLSGIRSVSTGGLIQLPLADLQDAGAPVGSSYLASDLSNSAVMQIFVPQNPSDQDGTVFALTGGNGLWRGVYGTDGEARWTWE